MCVPFVGLLCFIISFFRNCLYINFSFCDKQFSSQFVNHGVFTVYVLCVYFYDRTVLIIFLHKYIEKCII